jgi:hypothetical protein
MVSSKIWWVAGSAAVLLASGSARAAEQDTRTVAIRVDDSGAQRGMSGEQMRLVVLLPDRGTVATLPLDQPVEVTVRSTAGEIGYTVQPLGEVGRAAPLDDRAEIAAGNSGGRG